MLVAVAPVGDEYGLAAADISTGYFELVTVAASALEAELARLSASELVVPDGLAQQLTGAIIRPRADFESIVGGDLLKQHFALSTLDAIGAVTRAEQAAAGGLIAYLAHVGQGNMPFLKLPVRREVHAHLLIDQATRDSLEISAANKGVRAGSLLAEVDRTITGAGARQLASDLSAPLMDQNIIEARLSLVQWFHDAPLTRDAVRSALRQLPDIARALGRVVAGRGSPRDLGHIRDGLDHRAASTSQMGRFEAAAKGMVELQAANGGMQNRVDRLLESQEARKISIDTILSGKTDANMAEAVTELELAQISLQASAQVVSQLRQVSLLDYLR